jgi:hypothetical protein
MRRKSIIWIVAGVLAAAVLAAVAVIFYHVGFDHGANTGVSARMRMPLRSGVAIGFPRRFGGNGLGGLGVLLGLLAAGGIGALIVYLIVGPGRDGATVAAGGPTPAAGGGPNDPSWQQFKQWQQFEEWRRQAYGAAPEAPTAPLQPPVAPPVAQSPAAAPPGPEPAAPTDPPVPPAPGA